MQTHHQQTKEQASNLTKLLREVGLGEVVDLSPGPRSRRARRAIRASDDA